MNRTVTQCYIDQVKLKEFDKRRYERMSKAGKDRVADDDDYKDIVAKFNENGSTSTSSKTSPQKPANSSFGEKPIEKPTIASLAMQKMQREVYLRKEYEGRYFDNQKGFKLGRRGPTKDYIKKMQRQQFLVNFVSGKK